MLMSIYGKNERVGEEKLRTIGGYGITFNYPDTLKNHYQHIDAVDSHNSRS